MHEGVLTILIQLSRPWLVETEPAEQRLRKMPPRKIQPDPRAPHATCLLVEDNSDAGLREAPAEPDCMRRLGGRRSFDHHFAQVRGLQLCASDISGKQSRVFPGGEAALDLYDIGVARGDQRCSYGSRAEHGTTDHDDRRCGGLDCR